jgi:hypothetical protein
MLKVVGTEAAQDEGDGRSLLDEIAREGARRMLVAALETEVPAYLAAHREERDSEGHALVVRNAACALPVYASQRRLPDHHATLGSGWWPAFAGRDWRPAGTLRGFPSVLSAHLFPPPQASPGATHLLPIPRRRIMGPRPPPLRVDYAPTRRS